MINWPTVARCRLSTALDQCTFYYACENEKYVRYIQNLQTYKVFVFVSYFY